MVQFIQKVQRMPPSLAQLHEWHQVCYNTANERIPPQRWGHRIIKTTSNEVVLFYGYGGDISDGKYLSDVWSFSLETYKWTEVKTTGQAPESRSNYTLHYNSCSNEIIMFAGGAENKTRYNSVFVLNWHTKKWARYLPQQADEAPWQRTYHTSQFSYPYLIIHGGEGVSNLDLDDMWAFNIEDKTWTKLKFQENSLIPTKRRFHSSVLHNNYFYIFGGCTGNYSLLSDVYRVNLSQISNGQFSFKWQFVAKHKLLERWGHSCDFYDGKVYISCGRTSSSTDNNDMFSFDPQTYNFESIDACSLIKARRRHATVMCGNSLLAFGGYNGKYLNDFHYLTIKEQAKTHTLHVISTDNSDNFLKQIRKDELKNEQNFEIKLLKDGAIYQLESHRLKLQQHSFFKVMMEFTANYEQIQVELPHFCSIEMFRAINLSIIGSNMVICKQHQAEYYRNLFLSCEYFCCKTLMQIIQDYLISTLSEENCLQYLHLAIEFDLEKFKQAAAAVNLKTIPISNLQKTDLDNNTFNFDQIDSQKLDLQQRYQQKQAILRKTYRKLRFNLQQAKIREQNANMFTKAAKKISEIFKWQQSPTENRLYIKKANQSQGKQSGCIVRFLNYLVSFRKTSRVQDDQ